MSRLNWVDDLAGVATAPFRTIVLAYPLGLSPWCAAIGTISFNVVAGYRRHCRRSRGKRLVGLPKLVPPYNPN